MSDQRGNRIKKRAGDLDPLESVRARWFFEKNELHYSVTYADRSGAKRFGELQNELVHGGLLGRGAQIRRAQTEIYFTPLLPEVRLCHQRLMARLSEL
jgi:hypothetical protein